jgi:hypothetical protein
MKYPFAYVVQGYDYDEEAYYLENGVGVCESFKDAADILERRFGNELIVIKHIELYEYSSVIPLSPEVFKEAVDCLRSEKSLEIKCNEEGEKIL